MRIIEPPIKLSQWDTLIPKVLDVVPDGFQTIKQIAADRNRSIPQTNVIVKKLVEAGLCETAMFRGPGMKFATPHYRPINYGKTQVGQKHRLHR
jgi:hypothetical protein